MPSAKIFVTPRDLFNVADADSEKHGDCYTIILHDYMQSDTGSQQRMLFNATVGYIKGLSMDERPYTLWYEEDNGEEERAVEDSKRSYDVRQLDGTFRSEIVDQLVGHLMSDNYRKLQIKGTAREKQDFFEAVKLRLGKMKVVIGRDITRAGAVKFEYEDRQRHRLDDRIEWLEKDFKEMVLDGMEAAKDEEALVEGVNELEVERQVGDA